MAEKTATATLRQQLRGAGYSPVPLEGKAPPAKAWQEKIDTNDAEIELWDRVYPYAGNTGILTRLTPTIDIDILNCEAAEAIEALARERFEERGYILVRTGLAPKRAILLRTDEPFPKITGNAIAPDGSEGQKIELLGDGQQVAVFGIHPDTGKPYTWHGGEPGAVQWEDLPYINEAEARAFVDDAVRLLVTDHGYRSPAARPKERAKGNGAENPNGGADWAWLFANIRDGRELHDSTCALAAKLLATGMNDAAAVNVVRGEMECSIVPHDDRWQARYDDIPRAVSSAREKFGGDAGMGPARSPQGPEGLRENSEPLQPLPLIDMSKWDDEPVPLRDWAVLDRIPLRQTTLHSGQGAAGKSLIELHRSVAHVLGRDWLGTMPELGPALFIDAEDDGQEIHIRLDPILRHYGTTYVDLVASGLHLMSFAGKDAVLAAPARSGKIEPTALYKQILEFVGDIKPKSIAIASAANVFAGNENDRSQVQQCVSLLTRLAMVSNGGLVLVAHPSLTGINNDTGLSGNTAWHNSVRARYYTKGVKAEGAEEQPDNNLREIVFKKNNYGPLSTTIALQYRNGLFLPVPKASSLDQMARNQMVDDVYLKALCHLTEQGQDLGTYPTAPNYAPKIILKQPEAQSIGIRRQDLEAAQQRLLNASKINIAPVGPPSKQRKYLRPGPPTNGENSMTASQNGAPMSEAAGRDAQ